jgi:hypothetical protein
MVKSTLKFIAIISQHPVFYMGSLGVAGHFTIFYQVLP